VKEINLLITGSGGQGVILASDIIGETAIASGYDVKKTDTLGMSQRGGSVISHMRMSQTVYSPLIKVGGVDVMLSFEKLEAARWSHYLRKGAVVIVNNHALPPSSVSRGNEKYPDNEEIIGFLKRRTDEIYFIDGMGKARDIGNIKTLNILMLGCFSNFAPFEVNVWKESIRQFIPEKLYDINVTAFEQGRKEIKIANR